MFTLSHEATTQSSCSAFVWAQRGGSVRRLRLTGVLAMLSGMGPSVARAAAVVPASLLILFVGLLWLLGLACDEGRRGYVATISGQAMQTVQKLFHGRSS